LNTFSHFIANGVCVHCGTTVFNVSCPGARTSTIRPPPPHVTDATSRTVPLPFRTESSPTVPLNREEIAARAAELAKHRAELPSPLPAVDADLRSLADLASEDLDDSEPPTSPATPIARRNTPLGISRVDPRREPDEPPKGAA
jgi:hypothetical protein